MNGTTKIWAAACGAGIAAVLAGGWFVGVQPQLASAETTAQSTTDVTAQNQATQLKLAMLAKAAAKQDTMAAKNAVLLKAVPSVLKPNTFIRRISEVAALDGVTVASVAPGDSVAYTAPLSISGKSADGSPVVVAAQTDPLITGTDFIAVPATVSVSGTGDAVIQFVHDIQNDERLFAVSGLQTSSVDTGGVSATLSGYVYTLKR